MALSQSSEQSSQQQHTSTLATNAHTGWKFQSQGGEAASEKEVLHTNAPDGELRRSQLIPKSPVNDSPNADGGVDGAASKASEATDSPDQQHSSAKPVLPSSAFATPSPTPKAVSASSDPVLAPSPFYQRSAFSSQDDLRASPTTNANTASASHGAKQDAPSSFGREKVMAATFSDSAEARLERVARLSSSGVGTRARVFTSLFVLLFFVLFHFI
jgi:hypothetical protein